MAYSPAKDTLTPGSTSDKAAQIGNKKGDTDTDTKVDKKEPLTKIKTKPAVKVEIPEAKKEIPEKVKPKGGTYASAKKKDPKLDSYIKARNSAKKGSSDYNAAQNKINAAYGKGTTKRKVTVADGSKTSTGVMAPKAETKTKAEKITDTGIPKNVKAPKPKTAMEKAKEAIASGDKKAARKSGLKGKTKRVAKKLAKEVKKVTKSKAQEKDIAELTASASPTTFKSFDQMDSKNAMATAGESPAGMYDGPIKYFKGKINYDIKEASNSNLSQSARNNYAKNAQHDMKSMGKMNETMTYMHGSMKGDQSKTKMDYANFKGTDPKYHGKTGASHGDQSATRRDYAGKKGGSILSKHFKK